MRLLLAAISAGVLANCSAALAMSDGQGNAISHLGQVTAALRICDRAEANMTNVLLLMAAYDIDLGNPIHKAAVNSKADETAAAFAGQSDEAKCMASMMLYGPGGMNVPDMLRWKD